MFHIIIVIKIIYLFVRRILKLLFYLTRFILNLS